MTQGRAGGTECRGDDWSAMGCRFKELDARATTRSNGYDSKIGVPVECPDIAHGAGYGYIAAPSKPDQGRRWIVADDQ